MENKIIKATTDELAKGITVRTGRKYSFRLEEEKPGGWLTFEGRKKDGFREHHLVLKDIGKSVVEEKDLKTLKADDAGNISGDSAAKNPKLSIFKDENGKTLYEVDLE